MANSFLSEGNVGKFELKHVPVKGETKTVLNMSVRFNVDRLQSDGSWQDTGGFWAEVELWGKRAEAVSSLLIIGARVWVGGQLSDASFPSSDDPEVLVPAMKLVADFVAFSPLGIENISYKPRKGKQQPAPAGQPVDQGHLPPGPPPEAYDDDITY